MLKVQSQYQFDLGSRCHKTNGDAATNYPISISPLIRQANMVAALLLRW